MPSLPRPPAAAMALTLCIAALLLPSRPTLAQDVAALPNTKPLDWQGDLSVQMMDGLHRFVERKIDQSIDKRPQFWHREFSSPEAYAKSVDPNRQRLKKILGVVDPRVAGADGAVRRRQQSGPGRPKRSLRSIPGSLARARRRVWRGPAPTTHWQTAGIGGRHPGCRSDAGANRRPGAGRARSCAVRPPACRGRAPGCRAGALGPVRRVFGQRRHRLDQPNAPRVDPSPGLSHGPARDRLRSAEGAGRRRLVQGAEQGTQVGRGGLR